MRPGSRSGRGDSDEEANQQSHEGRTGVLIDYRHACVPDDFDAHLCIVCAGPACIAIARHFLGSALRVCLLEGGSLNGDIDNQSLYADDSIGVPELDSGASRLRAFGGSTNV